MAADAKSLVPGVEAPLDSNSLKFKVHLGIEDGKVLWSDPEEIAQQGEKVVWRSNLATERERQITWTNLAAQFLEGEIQNGMDDNGNGLIDERGFSIDIRGGYATVRLTACGGTELDRKVTHVEIAVRLPDGQDSSASSAR